TIFSSIKTLNSSRSLSEYLTLTSVLIILVFLNKQSGFNFIKSNFHTTIQMVFKVKIRSEGFCFYIIYITGYCLLNKSVFLKFNIYLVRYFESGILSKILNSVNKLTRNAFFF